MLTQGFQSFVAWRYLLARPMRVSRPLVALILACVVASAVVLGIGSLLLHEWPKRHPTEPAFSQYLGELSHIHQWNGLGRWLTGGAGALLVLAGTGLTLLRGRWRPAIGWGLSVAGTLLVGFAVVIGFYLKPITFVDFAIRAGWIALAPLILLVPLLVLRYFFTFFTTVSMAGVFVGAMALVVVLGVMSGFETDLRDKILGSNAHVRVTRSEGMIADWQAVLAKVRAVPGVVAVTPYATSEVVLSANSNHAVVVIKGIDPETVGDVTELVDDLSDKQAMDRLYPLREDELDEPPPSPGPDEPADPDGEPAVDPAPDDMVGGGDPIDYSGPDDPAPSPGADAPPPADDAGPVDPAPDDLAADGPVDPAPDDFAADDDGAPQDFSGRTPGKVTIEDLLEGDVPGEPPRPMPRSDGGRLALLDGVLVGKELEKQLHLFTGQEVRLVSPLADPANPDATGTPIPFHRDYRIAGVFFTGMYEYDLKFVYVPLESLQAFLQLGDEIDGIEVRVRDYQNTGPVKRQIQDALGPGFVVDDWKYLNRQLFSALELEKKAMFLVLAIIILVASFSILGNLIMVVVEKGKEIALLKTLGASDSGVMGVFVMQGFFIGLVGTAVGLLMGLAICWALQRFGFPIDPDVYYIDKLPVHVEWSSIALIGAAGLVISAVSTIYPAFVAARLRPAVGLRHD